ncbi:hypothetical protein EVG20_g1890 [Dentipellis fragilis]|uniref:Uncharacterized protein n=1 Tax=Dentipellis fragilis TaxID=205917 RepID=A0A4Y9ZBD6_9AGAM|nr:hypothetical protein EVG20_g1890 [Dentipellis fragilis]
MMSFPLNEVFLSSLFVEGFAYGICIALGAIAATISSRTETKGERVHAWLFSILLLMLVVATAHIILACMQLLIVYVKKASGGPDGGLVHSKDTLNRLFVARMALHMIQMSLSHAYKVWLFFVTFDRRKHSKVLLMATWTTISVSACWLLVHSILPGASTMRPIPVLEWTNVWHILMLANILYCTVAIIWKKYSNENSAIIGLDRSSPVLIPLIQSSRVSTGCLAALLIVLSMAISGYVVAVDLLVPLVPTFFFFLILRPSFKHLRSSREYSSINERRRSLYGRYPQLARRHEGDLKPLRRKNSQNRDEPGSATLKLVSEAKYTPQIPRNVDRREMEAEL